MDYAPFKAKAPQIKQEWVEINLDGVTAGQSGEFDLDKVEPFVESSLCAKKLYSSKWLSLVGFTHLESGDVVAATSALGSAYRISTLPVEWSSPRANTAGMLVNELNLFLALVSDAHLPEQVRAGAALICANLYGLRRELPEALVKLHQGQELTQDDAALHAFEGDLHCNLRDFPKALKCIDRATALGSTDFQSIHYARGWVHEQLKMDSIARECYQKYIHVAEPDERKVCEAYYDLAMLEARNTIAFQCDASKKASARRYFEKWLAAEQSRLPAFAKAEGKGCSNHSRMSEMLVGHLHACARGDCPSLGDNIVLLAGRFGIAIIAGLIARRKIGKCTSCIVLQT